MNDRNAVYSSGMADKITFTLNGDGRAYHGNPATSLLDALRDEYGMKGTKSGCGEGECGACSVILDGKLVNSCLVAMGRVDGCSIMTIEGYRRTERFKALDRAYASVAAVQCGYCIPGMVLASECILAGNPHPSEEEIREGISGNLCRCTGYNAIVKAIAIAALEGDGLW
jgi:carbon-monoxide dehydrogenase small subunit